MVSLVLVIPRTGNVRSNVILKCTGWFEKIHLVTGLKFVKRILKGSQ